MEKSIDQTNQSPSIDGESTLATNQLYLTNPHPYRVGANRLRNNHPIGYRLARKPNGDLILQGAYSWTEGLAGGVDWEEIPIVDLPV